MIKIGDLLMADLNGNFTYDCFCICVAETTYSECFRCFVMPDTFRSGSLKNQIINIHPTKLRKYDETNKI